MTNGEIIETNYTSDYEAPQAHTTGQLILSWTTKEKIIHPELDGAAQ